MQLLLVAFMFAFSVQAYAQCSPDNLIVVNLNHSLEPESCTSELTLDDVIGDNDIATCNTCTVTILDEQDNEMPAIFDFDDIGETFRYQLCCELEPGPGVICAWANITVEFKGNAQIICPPDDVIVESSCIELEGAAPEINDQLQCVGAGIMLVNEISILTNCVDNVQRQVVRTYQLTGPQGPIDQFCSQTINIVAADLGNLSFPPKETINCDEEPTVDITGVPFFTNADGEIFEVIPDSIPPGCTVFVGFDDTEFATPCGRTITRTWTVIQWSCENEEVRTGVQVIDVTDENPPIIECPPAIMATTTHDCQAFIDLPPAMISDDCTNELSVSVVSTLGRVTGNGGFGFFELGTTSAIYSVSDCTNTSTCTVDVTVADMTPPVAVCETSFTIGFAGTGNTFLFPYNIDSGSFDDCNKVELAIARMIDDLPTPDHMFGDMLEILCEDIGVPFGVILQVTDSQGNVSFCWVEVTVTNNLVPTLICAEPDTVACDTIFDPNSLNTFFNPFSLGGEECLGGFTVQDVLIGERNDCGVGELVRRIRLFDPNGVRVRQCLTSVVFEAPSTSIMLGANFPPMDICTPADVCTVEEIDDFDIEFDFEQQRCQLLGISTEIMETTADPIDCSGGPNTIDFCQQFVRRFTIIDWCNIDGPGSKSDPLVFDQVININEETPPVVVTPDEEMFCVPIDDCDELFVQIPAPRILRNNCGGTVTIEYELINDIDGLPVIPRMEGDLVSENLEVGDYTINWSFTDVCGNLRNVGQSFNIRNCKAPNITCIAGLALPILPGDNLATLEIKQVLVFAGNTCGDDSNITVSFAENGPLMETTTFSCDDFSEEPVSVNVFATDTDGNQSKCTVTVSLSDNGLCPVRAADNASTGTTDVGVSVSGNVMTPSDSGINGAEVALVGSSSTISTSTENGNYLFDDMPTGGSYVIRPSFEDDVLNGVSIVDMILIQQHILDIQQITNPYLLLAADVNGSGHVSIADVILLQRVALGLSELPSNVPVWTFVDADEDFFDAADPFNSNLSSEKVIDQLQEDEVYNFIGIKTGDINGSALTDTENRSAASAFLKVDNMSLSRNKTTVPFYLSESMSSIKGVSIELSVADLDLVDLQSAQLKEGTFSMDVADGHLKFISVNEDGISVDTNTPFFELALDGKSNTTIKEALQNATIIVAREVSGELTEEALNVQFDTGAFETEFINVIPNPWKDVTTVEINVKEKAVGSLLVTDLGGNVVHRNDVQFNKGTNTLRLSSEIINIPGVYFIHVNTPQSRQTVKMIKLE